MQQNLSKEEMLALLSTVTYLVGDQDIIANMPKTLSRTPFHEEIIEFLNEVSKNLMGMKEAKAYPDVVTLGFWMRKSSILQLKDRFMKQDGDIHMGRGTAFHIAPSNVPVNYAYSLVVGLLTGNSNIVRIPTKDFPQVSIVNTAFTKALEKYVSIKPYLCLIRYGRNQDMNDLLSSISDIRIIWGGDNTIAELRKSPLPPRASEITFADRYSLAVIDSGTYLDMSNKERLAEDFYNDTYLTDQNACTSPRIVVWTGNKKDEAKREFWNHLHNIVKTKYTFQPIMGVNKLSSSYLAAVSQTGVKIEPHEDNYIIRVNIPVIEDNLMELKDNSGYFYEYDCENILELKGLCDNTHCQTIGFVGEKAFLMPLLTSGMKGVDRVVPIGKTMDFDLIWDGYDLSERLTRTIKISI